MSVCLQKHLYISGRVQGVGFRHFIKTEAKKIGLKGWVKNMTDGRVEMVIAGRKQDVKKMLKLAEQGPRWANVEHIEIFNEEYDSDLDVFRVR